MEDIEAQLRQARDIVDRAELPYDLRPSAFEWVLGEMFDSRLATPSNPTAVQAPQRPGSTTPNTSIDRAAEKLGLSATELRRLFTIEGGGVVTSIPPSRLTQSKRPAMRELILATAAVRQAGGWESETSIQRLREICESFGSRFFDGNNYNNAVNGLADELRKVPSPAGLTVKLTPTGYTSAAALLKRLAGTDQPST